MAAGFAALMSLHDRAVRTARARAAATSPQRGARRTTWCTAPTAGTTSVDNLKDYCWWHHHIVLHQLGWILETFPDGTSQVTSPAGKTIRSHSPPPRPG